MKKIKISESCEPYMYTSQYDLKTINIGDVIDVTFKNKSRVKKEYLGKTIRFFVNNIMDYSFYDPYRRLAIIPLDKFENFTKKDAIIVDQTDRFDCLMIDLFPENRRPFAGWKNKIIDTCPSSITANYFQAFNDIFKLIIIGTIIFGINIFSG